MRAKFINENYPPGAEYDSNAPWNQSDPDIEYIVDLNQYGELELIERNYTSREPENEDWEDEKTIIDPYYMDQFLGKKLIIPPSELENIEDEGIEIQKIEESSDGNYILVTKYGNVNVSFDELESISRYNKTSHLPLLKENYESFKDLSKISVDVFKRIKNSKKLITREKISQLFNNDDLLLKNTISLKNLIKKYEGKFKDFLNSGLGILYANLDDSGWDVTGGYLNGKDLKEMDDPSLLNTYKKFPQGIIIAPSSGIFFHELQHAFDFYRSKGKVVPTYDSNEIFKHMENSWGYNKKLKPYYLDPSELNAYFKEAVFSTYWAEEKDINDNNKSKFYNFKDILYWFKKSFIPYDYLNEKGKKKYINKLYPYYEKIKDIYNREGIEGLKKRNLEVR
jgi:hypothetical protein